MSRDRMSERYEKKETEKKLEGLSQRGKSVEEIEAEEEMIAKAEKVKPIKAAGAVGRNDPCPCGSGKKYKKCCGVEK